MNPSSAFACLASAFCTPSDNSLACASVASNFAALPVSDSTFAAGAAAFSARINAAPSSPIATSDRASHTIDGSSLETVLSLSNAVWAAAEALS